MMSRLKNRAGPTSVAAAMRISSRARAARQPAVLHDRGVEGEPYEFRDRTIEVEHEQDEDDAQRLGIENHERIEKFGCGIAACGACTVHVDGQATRACVTPVSMVEGKSVTTIEGLSPDGNHPLQKAWVAEQVPQCGYCQSSQIMQAAELLARNEKPSREEIVEHMDGNICRCGTYLRIISAIERAAREG
jgi:isoquinoline 1-oxidoreductase subunit alpha